MRRRTTNNSCFTISIFLIGFHLNISRGGRDWRTYLVFEIRRGTTRLKEWLRIPQDDSFSSFVNHILKEGFQVCKISTNNLFSNANVFTFMFLHVFHWNNRKENSDTKFKQKENAWGIIPMELNRCWYVPGWLGWSKTMNRKFFQSSVDVSILLTNFIDSSKLSLPNLNLEEHLIVNDKQNSKKCGGKGQNTIIHHQGRCWAWNQWYPEEDSSSILFDCKNICFEDSRMLSLHHISPTSTYSFHREKRDRGDYECWMKRRGKMEPIGWINLWASEEGGSDGFSNAFNVRNVFVEEMRRNLFGNWLSITQQQHHGIIHHIWSHLSNCCNQTAGAQCYNEEFWVEKREWVPWFGSIPPKWNGNQGDSFLCCQLLFQFIQWLSPSNWAVEVIDINIMGFILLLFCWFQYIFWWYQRGKENGIGV